jgi:enoyl-CoA hydratase/carnithine racemase
MSSNIKIKKINSEISSIIIDEQKTYNSLSFQNLNDLLKAFKKLDNDKQLKVIILEGAGKGFSAGHN